MNEDFNRLKQTARRQICYLLSVDNYSRECYKPSVDYDKMRHLLPLEHLGNYKYRLTGVGKKSIEQICLWATGKKLPPKENRRYKRIKLFGHEFRITVTWKKIY